MNEIQKAIHTTGELLQTGAADAREQAIQLLEKTLAEQVCDETHISYGQFPKEYGGPVGDLNMALFILPRLVALRDTHAAVLPVATAEALDRAIRRALDAAQRRWDEEIFDIKRDHKAYSNIFLLYIQAFMLGGRTFGDERLARTGISQWKRWFHHVAYHGIDEFVSDYYRVDVEALTRIRALCPDPGVREQATRVLDYLAAVEHAVTHPVLKLPVCGASRNYRRFLAGADQEGSSLAAGATIPARDPRRDAGQDRSRGDYRPPDSVVKAYRERRFPYTVHGRAGSTPFLFQSWQDRHAALGSMTGGNYFWQQIHCMAAVGQGSDAREVLFMPGAYSIANGYVCQRGHRALCLFSRRPNTFLRTQKVVCDSELQAEFGDYGIGVSNGWDVTVTTGRSVFSAYGYQVVIDPFLLKGTVAEPVALEKVHRTTLSQGRFHRTPAEMTEYVFPESTEWFGCRVDVLPGNADRPAPPGIEWIRNGDLMTLRDTNGLMISLHLNPAGGDVERYDTDSRTLPLLQDADHALMPGELIINGGACKTSAKTDAKDCVPPGGTDARDCVPPGT